MAKLNMWEKEQFEINMDIAAEENITIIQSDDKMITVAVMPHDRMGHFTRIFVAYCGNETPKRKRGINAVMNRYANYNYILVPVMLGDDAYSQAYRMLSIIEDNYF